MSRPTKNYATKSGIRIGGMNVKLVDLLIVTSIVVLIVVAII